MPAPRIVFWASTLAAIGISAYSVVASPPPFAVALALALGYAMLVLSGVFVLRLRVFVDAVRTGKDLCAAPRGIVLTFDDGPDPVYTREVLDVLDAHAAKATFFVIGHKVDAHPEVVREIARRGHAIGIHGYAHDRLFALRTAKRVRADLKRAIRSIESVTKVRPTLFRPPIGHTNPTIARVVDELDLEIIGWSVAAYDGLRRTKSSEVVRRVSRKLEDGAIVLLHDAAERGTFKPAGVDALGALLDRAHERNLTISHLPDLFAERDAASQSLDERS